MIGNQPRTNNGKMLYYITPLIQRRAQSLQLHTNEIRYFGKNH